MILEGEVERLCWEKLKKYNFCKIEPGENEKKNVSTPWNFIEDLCNRK